MSLGSLIRTPRTNPSLESSLFGQWRVSFASTPLIKVCTMILCTPQSALSHTDICLVLEAWKPLIHTLNSKEILAQRLRNVPCSAAFENAFHHKSALKAA